jgi:phytanoyl-CoA hydroxylase
MFKVYKNVLDDKALDSILREHERFKSSPLSVFRPQGTTGFERPKIDTYKNQTNSIQNPHLLGLSKTFSSSIKSILYSKELYECMVDFTGIKDFIHYQSMFFDKSTGTSLHQDTWYLDTNPAGKLFGVWIALEDIDESSGPFYLYTNGPNCKLLPTDYNFSSIKSDDKFKEKYPDCSIFEFYAKKGDVLIWDSFNLHGAHKPINESKTRKSVTAHFYPAGTQIQDPPIKRRFSIYNHDKPINTSIDGIKSAGTINAYLYSAICWSLFLLGNFSGTITGDSSANKKLSEIRRLDGKK